MATLPNGESYQSFYRLLDASLTNFHNTCPEASPIRLSDGSTYYYIDKFNFVDAGLTLEEAASVRFLYVYDHPLYYWIYSGYVYDNTSIYICVESDYVTRESRALYNTMIYNGVAAMAAGLNHETSPYNVALAYYERLLGKADYAYEDDGKTPSDDTWAHNILGVFDSTYNAVVCEGFSKAYSLLLNYHGVENLLVPGISEGVGHLWSLIRVDDGNWYWCDLTWDDPTSSPLGTDYKYFCVTDTQNVLFYYHRDGTMTGSGGFFSTSLTFEENHTIRWDLHVSIDMSGSIPARAEAPIHGDMILRTTFTVDNMTYAITGYGKVQLINIIDGTDIVIPETVTYNGMTYTVTSVGCMADNGAFIIGSVLPWTASTVYIPKTVSHIWSRAFTSFWSVTLIVDPENPWYYS